MVEKIQKLINDFKALKGDFWIAALFKMDELVDRWTIILSAPWITAENRQEIFKEFADLLKLNLNKEELISIGQIGLLLKETHLIQELLQRRAGSNIENEKINGNTIYEGTIIESNPELEG